MRKYLISILISITYIETVNADLVQTRDKLEARISYITGVTFDLSYYKDRYDLELKHHGDMNPESFILLDANKNLVLWEENYINAIKAISDDKIILSEQDRMDIFKFNCRTLSGSKLIALFNYVKIVSEGDLKILVKYYIDLEDEMKNSDKKRKIDMTISWKNNSIPIPNLSEHKKIEWVRMVPYNYIKSQGNHQGTDKLSPPSDKNPLEIKPK